VCVCVCVCVCVMCVCARAHVCVPCLCTGVCVYIMCECVRVIVDTFPLDPLPRSFCARDCRTRLTSLRGTSSSVVFSILPPNCTSSGCTIADALRPEPLAFCRRHLSHFFLRVENHKKVQVFFFFNRKPKKTPDLSSSRQSEIQTWFPKFSATTHCQGQGL
jgi:hypothetical protein